MNTGQMLITIGAMFLLSMVVINTNKTFLSTGDVMYNTKFNVLATSIATSVIEEANSKSFDSITDTTYITDASFLTDPSKLGPETGETVNTFNDFDDYNNYVKVDSTMPAAKFKVLCRVGYVQPSNPDNFVNYKTFHKGIKVTVSSPSMSDTVRMSQIFSYWFYR